jgi:SAM-dependent methyltransferase
MFKNIFKKSKQVMTDTIEMEDVAVLEQVEVLIPEAALQTQEDVNDIEVHQEEIVDQELEPLQAPIDPEYLINAPEIVGWASTEEQTLLFTILASFYKPSESILDVGCGRADLLGFLQYHYPAEPINYKGIDYNPNILNIAAQKYPNVVVETVDLLSMDNGADYDWVVGSGLFNLNDNADMSTYTQECVEKMYEKSKVGVAFNLNTANSDESGMLVSWNAADWLTFLISKYGKVICRADYLDTDVTFFIFK